MEWLFSIILFVNVIKHNIIYLERSSYGKDKHIIIFWKSSFTICDVLNIIFDILIVGYSVFSLGIAWEKHLNLDRYEF